MITNCESLGPPARPMLVKFRGVVPLLVMVTFVDNDAPAPTSVAGNDINRGDTVKGNSFNELKNEVMSSMSVCRRLIPSTKAAPGDWLN